MTFLEKVAMVKDAMSRVQQELVVKQLVETMCGMDNSETKKASAKLKTYQETIDELLSSTGKK